jgi:16S rRNA (uracil1498-N3)-methyltransferase
MLLFYDKNISGDFHVLNEEESYHCTRVLRLNEGKTLFLTNGEGALFEAVIQNIGKKNVELSIVQISQDYGKRPFRVHIAIAPTKNIDRFEWFLEKATEIGIDEITPIICERSERPTLKTDRLERVIIAAMKQSLKAYKPVLNEPASFKKWISNSFSEYLKYIAICEDDNRQILNNIIQKNGNYLILIGPEGDFTPDEVVLAKNADFIPVSLGNSRLRTETAGVVACHIGNLVNEK